MRYGKENAADIANVKKGTQANFEQAFGHTNQT